MDLKKKLLERGMRLMGDPRVMKVMSNPKVMKMVMQAFQLRGQAQASVDRRVKKVARALKLATRDEVGELKATLRGLEQELKEVQSQLDQQSLPLKASSSS